jgi:hypothetical protein
MTLPATARVRARGRERGPAPVTWLVHWAPGPKRWVDVFVGGWAEADAPAARRVESPPTGAAASGQVAAIAIAARGRESSARWCVTRWTLHAISQHTPTVRKFSQRNPKALNPTSTAETLVYPVVEVLRGARLPGTSEWE